MSYNSLFGYGSHAPDPNLEGHWLLQETSGTSATDRSGKNRNGTILGMGASPSVAAGPTGYLTSSFSFDGTDDRVEMAYSAPQFPRTFVGWYQTSSTQRGDVFSAGTANQQIHYNRLSVNELATGQIGHDGRFQDFSGNDFAAISGNVSANNGEWRLIAGTINATTAAVLLDGDVITTGAVPGTAVNANTVHAAIGCLRRASNALFFQGRIAGPADFSRALTLAEINEVKAGPEPLNTTAPTLTFGGSTWHGTTGDWDSQSNGAISYTWQLRRSSDNGVEQSGTGTPGGSNPSAGDYYLWVRGSNLGGHDPAEDSVSVVQTLGSAFRRRYQSNQMATVGIIG